MFDEQLKKHDQLIGVIHQNLDAQDKILKSFDRCKCKIC
jgi:hypothetical protein